MTTPSYRTNPTPPNRDVRRLGRIAGATNPESAELLADGTHILFTNCRMVMGHPAYRAGQGLVYVQSEAFLSVARIDPDGTLALIDRHALTGLTATLGIDLLRHAAGRFPAGAAIVAEGGNPITQPGATRLLGGPGQSRLLIVAPDGRTQLGAIPLNPGSALAGRFNPIDQPNGVAVNRAGDLFFGDIPNSNPAAPLPSPVPAAIYRIQADAIEGMAENSPASAAQVQRIEMPGWVNGLCADPHDNAIYAVSCSFHCPVGGGVYRLSPDDFATGTLPPPLLAGLGGGLLDGVGITRRGTLLASAPMQQAIHAFTLDGAHFIVTTGGANPVILPADFNVCYPAMLHGEPALLVPDLTMGGAPGEGSVSLLDFSGY